jgi:hypothetical protein
MLPTIAFVVTCFVVLERLRRRYYTKSFKNAFTQTEFQDLYPDFFEGLPLFGSDASLFGESSSEHSTLSEMSVVNSDSPDFETPDFEILNDYIKCPSIVRSSEEDDTTQST